MATEPPTTRAVWQLSSMRARLLKNSILRMNARFLWLGRFKPKAVKAWPTSASSMLRNSTPTLWCYPCLLACGFCRGHRGRAEIRITLRGQPVHASDPSKGFNAIYGMEKILAGIQELNETLPEDPFLGKATVAVTHIESTYNGPNMLPESCHIIVDRRLTTNDEQKKILAEIKNACKGTKAKIEIVECDEASYRGLRLPMEKYFPTWTLEEEHPLIESVESAYRSVFKKLELWTVGPCPRREPTPWECPTSRPLVSVRARRASPVPSTTMFESTTLRNALRSTPRFPTTYRKPNPFGSHVAAAKNCERPLLYLSV